MTETNQNREAHRDRLTEYRKSIDEVDRALIALLAERFRLTEKIGETKAATGLPPADLERERAQRELCTELCALHGLNVNVALDIMARITEHVKQRHQALQAAADAGQILLAKSGA